MVVTWGWLLVGAFCIIVSLAMGEIASTYPTAGGLYYWSSRLGSPVWGWFTGWFNLVGQIAVTAAICYGAAIFVTALLGLWFDFPQTARWIFVVYSVILLVHGIVNTFGSRLLARVNNISAWWHMVGVLVVVGVLIFVPTTTSRSASCSPRRSTPPGSRAWTSPARCSGSWPASAC